MERTGKQWQLRPAAGTVTGRYVGFSIYVPDADVSTELCFDDAGNKLYANWWGGIRLGELLALTASDFNFERQTLTINKSLQNIRGNIIITPPKTPKSNRTIKIPQFLVDEMQDYIKSLYGLEPDDRIFPISKAYLHHEMNRGAKAAGVKRIRIHDLRHSHVSLLIEMGFSAVAIAERVGHESIDITYRYAHLFPTKQTEMANRLNSEWTKEEDKPCPEK